MSIELLANTSLPGTFTSLGALTAPLTEAATSMEVSAPAPTELRGSGSQFRVRIDREWMIVEAPTNTSTTWTIIQRGAESSTAAAHASGAEVFTELTAGALRNFASPLRPEHSFGEVEGVLQVDLSKYSAVSFEATGDVEIEILNGSATTAFETQVKGELKGAYTVKLKAPAVWVGTAPEYKSEPGATFRWSVWASAKATEANGWGTTLPASVVNSRTAASFKPLGAYPLEAFESINKAIEEIHEKYGGGALMLPAGATNCEAGAINMLSGVVLTGPAAEWSVTTEHPTAWLKAVAGTAPIINFATTTHQAGVRNLGIVASGIDRPGIWLPESTNRNGNRLRNVELYECGSPTKTFEAEIESGHLTELKGVTSFAGIEPGTVLVDTAHVIPEGTTVLSVNEGAKTLVMSNAATGAHALQKIEAVNMALFVGQRETRIEDLLVFHSKGVGLVIAQQDCYLGGDNSVGFSAGHGVILGIESGPLKIGGSLDTYDNEGDGLRVNGYAHRLGRIQSNNNAHRNLLFLVTARSTIMHYVGESASQEGAGLYPDTAFAHPTASNTGCGILGGSITTADEKAKYGVEGAEAVVSFPALIGIDFLGGLAWSTGSGASHSVHEYTNFAVRGCTGVPDVLMQEASVAPLFRPVEGNDQTHWYNKGVSAVASGITGGGALYLPITAQALATNGKVTINAKEGNIAAITLEANAESSEITNPTNGQQLTIQWIQDNTGSRTYAWPTNCHFAGGAAPSASTTKGYTDSVTFVYSSAATQWKEISRAVAVR